MMAAGLKMPGPDYASLITAAQGAELYFNKNKTNKTYYLFCKILNKK